MNVEGDGQIRLFDVSEPQAPDGYTIYKVTLRVFTKSSGVSTEGTEAVVWRRFSQFLKLRKELVQIYHKTKGDVLDFPLFVKTNYFDRFKEQVIEERRVACLQLLQFVGSQPVLYTSKPFTKFFKGGSVVASGSQSSLASLGSLQSRTSGEENGLSRSDSVPCEDLLDLSVGALAAMEREPSQLPDIQSSWPSVFDSPVESKKDFLATGDPVNSSKHNLYNSDSDYSPFVNRRSPDGQEQFAGVVVDDLVDIRLPLSDRDSEMEEKQNIAMIGMESADGKERQSVIQPGGISAIDLDNLPKLTVSELGDVRWATQQNSLDPSSGFSSPPGGVWLHQQPSDVSSLSSNDGNNQAQSESTIDVGELRKVLSAEFEEPQLSEDMSPLHSQLTSEQVLEPVSHTSTATSDSEADGPCELSISKTLASNLDIVGFEAEDDWWKQALSVCDQELADGLESTEGHETYKADINDKIERDSLSRHNQSDVNEAIMRELAATSSDLQPEGPTEPVNISSCPTSVVSQDYVLEASKILSQAITCEAQSDYQNAFDLYKTGVEMLLTGVQSESNKTKRQMVRKKTGQYLLRAELIFKQYIGKDGRESLWEPSQPNQVDQQPEAVLPHLTLTDFKVLGLIDNVQLVQDKQTGEVYILKSLRKTHNPQVYRRRQKGKRGTKNRGTVDLQCPHMVRLIHHFDTPSCIFLVLEYIAGGKIIDFISSRWDEIKRSEAAQRFQGIGLATHQDRNAEGSKHRLEQNVLDKRSEEMAGLEQLPTGSQAQRSCGVNEVISEQQIAVWAAQLVKCLSCLHQSGVVCCDLRPDNLLLSPEGNLVLTYFGYWDQIDRHYHPEAAADFYIAPELNGMLRVSPAADWWSFGVILFELLTGKRFKHCNPGGPHSYIPLNFPVKVSNAARSLIRELLHVNALERLGSGIAGIEEIITHPFFGHIDWDIV
ncbi:ribosomal protein S6 kinase delta-1-like isoform X2 [Corticium candelabrum]|uniref:ribosomal protein S6 kinase delta-1-like isoform X2 n=1 Tax=Corticium candelabrum TaxID=121492 RepID=UPI002E26B203|nr:ribosomal protein S6 kinase delta-1-like isoform X2 [Corticium candelabrum]